MPLLADIPAQGLFTGVINFFYKNKMTQKIREELLENVKRYISATSPGNLMNMKAQKPYTGSNVLVYQRYFTEIPTKNTNYKPAGIIVPSLVITPNNFGYIRDMRQYFGDLASVGIVLHVTPLVATTLRDAYGREGMRERLTFATAHN